MSGFDQFSTHLCMAAIPPGLDDRLEKTATLNTLSASYKNSIAPGTGSSEIVSCPSHPDLYEWSTPSKSTTRVFLDVILLRVLSNISPRLPPPTKKEMLYPRIRVGAIGEALACCLPRPSQLRRLHTAWVPNRRPI